LVARPGLRTSRGLARDHQVCVYMQTHMADRPRVLRIYMCQITFRNSPRDFGDVEELQPEVLPRSRPSAAAGFGVRKARAGGPRRQILPPASSRATSYPQSWRRRPRLPAPPPASSSSVIVAAVRIREFKSARENSQCSQCNSALPVLQPRARIRIRGAHMRIKRPSCCSAAWRRHAAATGRCRQPLNGSAPQARRGC
jgi:hypothetical protein